MLLDCKTGTIARSSGRKPPVGHIGSTRFCAAATIPAVRDAFTAAAVYLFSGFWCDRLFFRRRGVELPSAFQKKTLAEADFRIGSSPCPACLVRIAGEVGGAENLRVDALGADAMRQQLAALIGRGYGREHLLEACPTGFQKVSLGILDQPGMFQFCGKTACAGGKNFGQGQGGRRGADPEAAKYEKSSKTAHVLIIAPKIRANNSCNRPDVPFWPAVFRWYRLRPKTKHNLQSLQLC